MNKERILLCMCHMSGNERKFVDEAFDTNWVVPLGPHVNAFENELQQFIGQDKSVVALSSGTAALHLALVACGVQRGDEVICQSFTFCASCNPIVYLGATPVFVDSENETWNMDPELMEHAIQDRIDKTGKKPKAIVMVHLYGMPAKISRILEVAGKYGIPVVEDAAEAMGSQYEGRECGSFGRFGVLSFNGNKMITTSGGGALICPDADAKREIMYYATQARESYPYYHHENIGYNYRLSNISAAIGRGQMTILNEHINHHRMVADMYRSLLARVPGITFHEAPSPISKPNYWLSTITIDPTVNVRGQENVYQQVIEQTVGGTPGVAHTATSVHTDYEPNSNIEAMRLWLDAENIESRPLWKPMHLQPVYAKAPAYTNGVSQRLFSMGLCLPSGPYVTGDHVRLIVDRITQGLT